MAAALAWSAPAFASAITDEDPLHAFCYGSSVCSDTGQAMAYQPGGSSLQFGFTISPGPQTGDNLIIDLLIPTNAVTTPSALSFSLTGTQGGTSNNQSISETSSLFSSKAWTKGNLINYLGLTAAPNTPLNSINMWLPITQLYDPGATGYYNYIFDLGPTKLFGQNKPLSGPLLTLEGLLPEGALIAGFLVEGTQSISTANDSTLAVDDPPTPVPEPASLALLAAALLGLGIAGRRMSAKRPTRA